MNRITFSTVVCFLISVTFLSGCEWVDSAGTSGSSTPVTSVLLDDTPVGDAIVLNEQGGAVITASRQDSTGETLTYTFSDEPLAQGVLPECIGQDGFNEALAADTLQQACPLDGSCELDFEAVDNPDLDAEMSEFILETPALDASVGLVYTLTVTEANGLSTTSDYTFCLIAINEAPVAEDDVFVVEDGEVLVVTADSDNLLSNDSDDTDVSNTEFSILPDPSRAPEFAAFFELGTDGSFTYQSSLTDSPVDQFDRFDYQLTDGVFVSEASVTIRIVARNQPPEQTESIPVLEAMEDVPFSVDLSSSFSDPEGGELVFTLNAGTPLAVGTGLDLDTEGLLSGTPTAADVGTYALSIDVSDGDLSTLANVIVAVEAAPVEIVPNTPPEFVPGSVFSQTVLAGTTITPVRARFTDSEDDTLTYSMGGTQTLPEGIRLNRLTGVISGRSVEIGIFRALRVIATDSSGESARSTAFNLTITAS